MMMTTRFTFLRALALLLCCLSFATACGTRSAGDPQPQDPTLGLTSEQLKAQMGEPTRVATPVPGKLVWHYSAGIQFQLGLGRVEAHTIPPANAQQGTLQYWRHKCVGQKQELTELSGTRDAHGRSQLQFRCIESHINVIYDPELDRVTEVVRYAQ